MKNNTSVIIFDNKDNCLSFDLRDILALVSDATQRTWVISNMEINVLFPEKSEMSETDLEFIYKLNNNGTQRELSWQELGHLSELNIQIVDGNIIGEGPSDAIEIYAHDSTYWIVNTDDLNLIKRIKNRFNSIKTETD